MAFTPWQRYITDGEDVVPGADIEVRRESDGALATIYSDPSGTVESNPFPSDAEGLARFYAAAGRYKITATSGSFESEFRHEPVGEAQGYDVGDDAGGKLLTRDMLDTRFYPNVQDNLNATSDPTVNDDTDAGYSIRSLWFNVSTDEVFRCVDDTAGAAVWVNTSLELSELGSAATKDTGTAQAEVPTNADRNIDYFPISGNITLDGTHNLRTAWVTADATVTLPVWGDEPPGYAVAFLFDGSHTLTLATQGSDTVLNSDTEITTNAVLARTPTTDQWGVFDTDNVIREGDNVSLLTNDAGYLTQSDVRTSVREETGTSYTYALADEDTYIEHNNSSAITVTIPTNASVAFPIGAEIAGEQTGSGQVTIQGDTGVTVQAPGGRLSTVQQYSPFSVIKVGTDEWRVHGDLQ